MRLFFKPFVAVIWASPWSCVGILLGIVAILTGGGLQRRGRVVEFYGGIVAKWLGRIPISGGASALTLGHTILGRERADLRRCREHELVHVAQYERWGPFFVPAYLMMSVAIWIVGRRAYRDNPFEVEAYSKCNITKSHE